MEYIKLNNIDHPLFPQAWKLYKTSFPAEERRQLRTQKKIMDNPFYHFDLITDAGSFVGFVFWWGFDDLRYIEHFATLPHLRGKGYGQRIIQKIISDSDIPVILEVEHPIDSMSKRRIGFYQRNGFVVNEHTYSHPPYKKGGRYIPLMLMTYPTAITENGVKRFLKQHHPIIHEFVLQK